MKRILYLLFFACSIGAAQTVTIDNSSYTPLELTDILLGDGCVQVTNASVSSLQSVAYFNDQGGSFPISEGVIIRTGKAKYSEGSYTDTNLSSQINSSNDPYLDQIFAGSGQNPTITDIAFLQFEFTPVSTNFNFDFLFASNEYGTWQCVSSDVFAFLLTDLITGVTTNLAVIPNTTTPISIRSIKDKAYNPTCSSDNPNLFSTYQVTNPIGSTINMRGYTVVMNAATGITPGNPYRIRLVVGDSNDSDYDSAIFLAGGSFKADFELGGNRVICDGDLQTIDTGLNPSVYTHAWTYNGTVLSGQTSNVLQVTQSGTYGVTITSGNTACLLSDQIVFTDLMVQNPNDLMVCYDPSGNYVFDLTQNDEATLGISNAQYNLSYYASSSDVAANNPIAGSNLNSFLSAGNQTIYIKIKNKSSGHFCNAVYSFNLLINDAILLTSPSPIEICARPNASPSIDLTQKIGQILNGQNASDFNISYFQSFADAQSNLAAISDPTSFAVPSGFTTYTIWVRVEDAQMPECFNTISFDIIRNQPPNVESLPDVIACSSYTLPPLTFSDYFTSPNGNGQHLFPGDVITDSGTYYIFNGPDVNGCTNQSKFKVLLADEYEITDTTYCGEFTIPTTDVGKFYTAPGGPSGTGSVLPAGSTITSTQTIYYYVEINGVFCRDEPFAITVFPLPPVDQLPNVVTCDQYVLPVLANGNYFTQTNGNGTPLNAGDIISNSKNIYIFNDDGTCTNQHVFKVTIIQTADFADVDICGSYTLPQVEVGGYFTQPGGSGQQIPVGTQLTTTQTIYYYAVTTSSPNCTENISFEVVITPIPPVDGLPDILRCENDPYLLPPLTNGQFFTKTNRNGSELFPGDTITTTQTIYINNLVNGCDNETDFVVEIRSLPPVEEFTDVYSCDPYELPALTNGSFYTQPGGTGTLLPAGEMITSTQTLYIYNDYDDLTSCYSETNFTAYINGVPGGDFEFADISACDQYILPSLTIGNYFTQSGGNGTPLFAGDTIATDQELFVYAENGDRFVCTEEDSFLISISETPVLGYFGNIESCGQYTLPDLPQSAFDIGYYRSAHGENEIPADTYTIAEPGTYTIYVYATSKDNPDCFDETQFELTIYPLLELNIEGGTLCRNLQTGEIGSSVLLTSGLDPNEFEVNWYLNAELVHTGSDFEAVEPGTYTVKTVKLIPEIGAFCNYKPTTVTVLESAKPIIEVTMTQPFSDIAVITVSIINGVGTYEYQLDQNGYQNSNEFYDVASGHHTVSARGINGNCGETVINVEVIKFPKYFTPNGDGINDRWNIVDLLDHPEALITIFDRYGKLMSSFPAHSAGWDGTYNGEPMPSNEYWFMVTFEQDGTQRIFKSHFSLIR